MNTWLIAGLVVVVGVIAAWMLVNVAKKSARTHDPVLGFFRTRPQLRGFLWGVFVSTIGFVLYQSLATYEQPKEASPMTQSTPAAPAVDPEIEALQAKLSSNPNDTASLAALSHKLLRATRIEEANELNKKLLMLEPNNTEGLVHQAVLKAAHGDQEQGLNDLTTLLKTHDNLAEGWFFRGMLSMQLGKNDLMLESFKKFVEVAPEGPQKERIKQMLAQGMGK
jgi:tetratricopeptide (TPR) repeat protein